MPKFTQLPCYILCGPEIGKRNSFIKDIRKRCADADGAQPEYHTFYADDTSVEELINLLQNGSLFSSRRIVEYRNAELVTGKNDIAVLAGYAASPSPEALLFLITESYSLAKPLETAVGSAGKVVFWELRDYEKPTWVRERLAQYRLSIDDEALTALFELVENETSALDSACIMLAAYFPAGTRLGIDEIESTLSKSRQEDAFSLFDRISGGDMTAALNVLDTLLADRQSDATQIIAALVWSFRKIERLHFLTGNGAVSGAGQGADAGPCLDLETAFRQEKITTKTGQRKFRAALRQFSADECSRAVRAAAATEGALRGGLGASFERPLLHLLICSIMSGNCSSPALSGWKEEEYYRFN
ncbi:MAG: DNA polymerase III subunit delta [Spirochaetaceae bacterium]|nr:DNA polymerase III subunit delta [Spirochaetaceae bacterium]